MSLPQGWAVTTLGDVASYINGRAFKPTEWETQGLPIIRIQNLNNTDATYNYSQVRFEDKYLVRTGDLLFAWSASLGSFIWRGGDAWLNQHIFKVLPYDGVSKWYLHYYLLKTITEFYSKTHGSGMVHITSAPFKETCFALPPLAEQHRIVAKIDALFSELDKGVEMLQTVRVQLRTYRQAVLKWAFEGQLTAIWRKEHLMKSADSIKAFLSCAADECVTMNTYGIDPEFPTPPLPVNWHWISIGSLSKGIEYGTSAKSDKTGKVIVLRMGNIQNCGFVYDDLAYTSDDAEIEKYILNKNDVLFNRTNSAELVGKTAIYLSSVPSIFAGYLMRVNQISYINARYLNYYLNSPNARRCGKIAKTDGVNQANINGKKLARYPFPLCSIDEQAAVVVEIESRLSICDKLEQLVDEILSKAQALRQSILKKAFAGELVPQDPHDEPAEKLLERIKAMKATATKTTTARRARK